MSTDRELLELAARAMGFTVHEGRHHSITVPALWISPKDSPLKFSWAPSHSSEDAANMCAALGIDTEWGHPIRPPREIVSVSCLSGDHYRIERLKDHNNDRAAAWRMAALRVAAQIGKDKPQ